MLLVASFCFASFTFCVSAADGDVSATAQYQASTSVKWFGGNLSIGDSKTHYENKPIIMSRLLGFSCFLPSAGTAIFSFVGAGKSTVSGPGVTSSLSGNTLTIIVESSSASDLTLTVSEGNATDSSSVSLSLVSWTPGSSGGGGDNPGGNPNDSSGNSILGPSQGGMDIWNSDGSINGDQRNDITGNSSQWNIHDTYIGQLDYFIQGDEATYETSVWISKMLANLAYTTWSWKYDESTGNFLYVRPNPGSWLDNMWQMNIYLYYNLANQKGWFGHINSEFSSLNSRVLQILSVLANDEDVKIKDATTDHRNWITAFFEGNNTGKPTPSDNDAVNNSMNTVKDQFQSSYSVGDIGSIFSGNSYDNNIWYTFWTQPVFNDVNGIGRGGFGGGKAPARSPAVSKPSWSSQYSYDDDSIPDMFGFGGGLSD